MSTLPAAGERELVEQAKTDPNSFGELYDRHFPRIYRFVFSRVRDQSAAEDITSEVFFKALRNIQRYQYGGPFSAWLYQIALNAVTDHYRARRGDVELEAASMVAQSGPSTADQVVRRDLSRRIWDKVDRLPKQQRAAMILKFGEDLKIDEIAIILGKSPGAVKLLLHRATGRLRGELAEVEVMA